MGNNSKSEYEATSEYNNRFAFLSRIDQLLFLASKTDVENNNEAYHKVLKRVYIELSPFITRSSKKESIKKLVEKCNGKTPILLRELDIELRDFMFEKKLLIKLSDDPRSAMLR